MVWTRRSVADTVLAVMDEHRKAVGQRAAKLREAAGLSQEEVAADAGVSVKTVSRFENGRHDGRRTTIRQIAKALNVTEVELLGPPPAPLGLDAGPSQLDRIETMLRALCEAQGLGVELLLTRSADAAAKFEAEIDEAVEQDERPDDDTEEDEPGRRAEGP